jgi:hypothetical protein
MKECNQHSLNKFRYGIYTSDFGHLLYGCMACPMIAQKGASGDKELVEFARIDFDSAKRQRLLDWTAVSDSRAKSEA